MGTRGSFPKLITEGLAKLPSLSSRLSSALAPAPATERTRSKSNVGFVFLSGISFSFSDRIDSRSSLKWCQLYAISIYHKSIKMSLADTKLFNDYPVELIEFHWYPLSSTSLIQVVQGEGLMHQSPPYYQYCWVLTSFALYSRHLIQYSLTDCLWHNQIDIKHGK